MADSNKDTSVKELSTTTTTTTTTPQPTFSQQTLDGVAVPQGVILPPPEVRSVVEKTAAYVARNGRGFEERIRENEKANVKFSFIKEDDPYFPYYSWRVSGLEEGGPSIGGNPDDANGTKAASNGNTEDKKDLVELPKPAVLEFSFNLPPLSAQDYDVIKLTALYVARNGNQFQKELARAESSNFQYDFLKPAHSLFPLFNNLVEQYKKVINPPPTLLERIKKGASEEGAYAVINRSRIRAEWDAHQAAETEKAAEASEKERLAYSSIDWHDFVVVETIRFTEADERAKLPAPMSKAQLEYASLEQKRMSSLRLEEAPPDFDEDEAKEEARRGLEEKRRKMRLEQQSRPSPPLPASLPKAPRQEESPEPSAPASLPPGMKIKSAGTSRRTKGKGGVSGFDSNEPMVESPLTGERIPQSQLEEHMRITLLDPKWKEQKSVADSRRATTNLSTSEVAANIKRLASHLQQGEENEEHNEEEAEPPRKKQATEVQWDGYSGSKSRVMKQAAAQTSAKSIQEAKQREMERLNKIGPKAR